MSRVMVTTVGELGCGDMGDVLDLHEVTVRRGVKTILDHVSWSVEEGERWVVLCPNGAGKTTLMQLASARMHPSAGTVDIFAERLGAVDIFEMRPRIRLSIAAGADRTPRSEPVLNVVMTESDGMTGRWWESYEALDADRAQDLLAAFGVADLGERLFHNLPEGERKRVQLALE